MNNERRRKECDVCQAVATHKALADGEIHLFVCPSHVITAQNNGFQVLLLGERRAYSHIVRKVKQ